MVQGMHTARVGGSRGESKAAAIGRLAGLLGLGVVGTLFGGFPIWAARRILYPLGMSVALPQGSLDDIDVGLSVKPVRVEFPSADGHALGGWFVPGPARARGEDGWPAVLLVHGYGGWKEQMLAYAQIVHEGGFASLMFDMQGSGTLRGKPITFGVREQQDLLAALRYLASRPDVDSKRLGVLGVSMGAATALLAAAREPAIRAVVADSGYADLSDMVKPGLRAFLGPLALLFAPLIVRIAEAMAGVKTSTVVPEKAAANLGERPLFVIHGQDDPLISAESAHRIYNAASGPKELWVVPECLHGEAPNVAAQEYRRRVNAFFLRWLGANREAVA